MKEKCRAVGADDRRAYLGGSVGIGLLWGNDLGGKAQPHDTCPHRKQRLRIIFPRSDVNTIPVGFASSHTLQECSVFSSVCPSACSDGHLTHTSEQLLRCSEPLYFQIFIIFYFVFFFKKFFKFLKFKNF